MYPKYHGAQGDKGHLIYRVEHTVEPSVRHVWTDVTLLRTYDLTGGGDEVCSSLQYSTGGQYYYGQWNAPHALPFARNGYLEEPPTPGTYPTVHMNIGKLMVDGGPPSSIPYIKWSGGSPGFYAYEQTGYWYHGGYSGQTQGWHWVQTGITYFNPSVSVELVDTIVEGSVTTNYYAPVITAIPEATLTYELAHEACEP